MEHPTPGELVLELSRSEQSLLSCLPRDLIHLITPLCEPLFQRLERAIVAAKDDDADENAAEEARDDDDDDDDDDEEAPSDGSVRLARPQQFCSCSESQMWLVQIDPSASLFEQLLTFEHDRVYARSPVSWFGWFDKDANLPEKVPL